MCGSWAGMDPVAGGERRGSSPSFWEIEEMELEEGEEEEEDPSLRTPKLLLLCAIVDTLHVYLSSATTPCCFSK